jgi:hypothetical protein
MSSSFEVIFFRAHAAVGAVENVFMRIARGRVLRLKHKDRKTKINKSQKVLLFFLFRLGIVTAVNHIRLQIMLINSK